MTRKEELQKMTVLGELSELARKYNLDIDHMRKSEIIEAILKHEEDDPKPKVKRGPREQANTKLKALRVSSGLTQLEVATRANLNPRTYQFYEQGYKPIEGAKLETLIQICLALNCKLEDIVEDESLLNLLKQYN